MTMPYDVPPAWAEEDDGPDVGQQMAEERIPSPPSRVVGGEGGNARDLSPHTGSDAEQAELRRANAQRRDQAIQQSLLEGMDRNTPTQAEGGEINSVAQRHAETNKEAVDGTGMMGLSGGGGGPGYSGPPIVVERQVGMTKGGFQPSTRSSAQTVEGKQMLPEWWNATSGEANAGVMAADADQRAAEAQGGRLYDIAKRAETSRRDYFTQERDAEKRFEHDQQQGMLRMQAARERLRALGPVPDTTISAAFRRADGPRKVAGFVGMLLSGFGSAATGQPNQFFERFNSEAEKVVDRYMREQGRLGNELEAEHRGMDEIRRAFGDERAARDFVMAALMNTYRSKLEQAAAQYGIDKSRADYQAALAMVNGKLADRLAQAAPTIQEQAQYNEKYAPPRPIMRKEVVYDPQKANALEAELNAAVYKATGLDLSGRSGKDAVDTLREMGVEPSELPPGTMESYLALDAYKQRAQAYAQGQPGGPEDKATLEAIDKYGKAREDTGLNDSEAVALAVQRIADKIGDKKTGVMQQISNYLSSGAGGVFKDHGALATALARQFADDPGLSADFALVANQYRLDQSGKSVTRHELGGLMAAIGNGDERSIRNFSNGLNRQVDNAERGLIARFGEVGYQGWHARRQSIQKRRLPHQDYRAP